MKSRATLSLLCSSSRFALVILGPVLIGIAGCGGASSTSVSPSNQPTITVSANPASVTAGSSSSLTVAATNASTVTVNGSDGSNYTLAATGGTLSVTPTATTAYTTTATSADGTATAKTSVTVTARPAATVSIAAAPSSIAAGSSSTLTVVATDATNIVVTGSDGSSYTLTATGGTATVSPAATTVYTATATGAGASATAQATVTVNPAPTASISANPQAIVSGSSSTLTVVAANATNVVVTGSDGSSYTLAATGGTRSVSPSATTTYTATATEAGTSASAKTTLTVAPAPVVTVSITATPQSITAGNPSTLNISAANAGKVIVTGTDNSSYTLGAMGGMLSVSPSATTTYTATATGANSTSATAQATITVDAKTITSIAVTSNATSFALGATQQFTATATYSDNSTGNVSSLTAWSVANTAVATVDSTGLATSQAAGSTSVSASLNGVSGNASFTVTIAAGTGVNIPMFHVDANRSGLNGGELSLTPSNVSPANFGKLFSYLVDGYVYGEPLLMSNIAINGAVHNVLYVATENDSVYAFDADNYGTGAPLWQVSLLLPGEHADTSGPITPVEGVTSTPVIDPTSNTIYVLSKQTPSGAATSFRLNALDITTGAQKLGGPITIQASVPATNSAAVNGVQTLTTSCTQRAALLLAYGNVYIGFGSCHTGWLLAYNANTLAQVGVFNASPNLDGEGEYASAGGVWMGAGGPTADGNGNVYITTGNGPWDGQTAFSDSVLKFSTTLTLEDYFTPDDYQFMDCDDGDLASGGLLLIPGASQALAGGKGGKLYLVSTNNLGQESANDAGAAQAIFFEPDLSAPFPKTCTDSLGAHTAMVNSYEIFGTSTYFNGSVYLGVTPTSAGTPAGIRQFALSGNTLTPGSYTSPSVQENTRGTTAFISADGASSGILWMIDEGLPLDNTAGTPTTATLRAYDAEDLSSELYNSGVNPTDAPGYGIKFTSPVIGNGKAYISTGHDLTTATNPQGEIDVYGLN